MDTLGSYHSPPTPELHIIQRQTDTMYRKIQRIDQYFRLDATIITTSMIRVGNLDLSPPDR